MRKLRKPLMACVALIGLMATSLAVAGPAQAYTNADVSWKMGWINTGTCAVLSGSDYTGYSSGDYCVLGGSSFKKDSGGMAFKAEAFTNGVRRAKFEFHPHGEHLKVCDTSNDGDSIHAVLKYLVGSKWEYKPLASPPGTSAEYECTDKNYSFDEGHKLMVEMYDNTSMTDWMASAADMRA